MYHGMCSGVPTSTFVQVKCSVVPTGTSLLEIQVHVLSSKYKIRKTSIKSVIQV